MGIFMKLYEVPRRTFINYKEDDIDIDLFFDHVDGSYSFCLNSKGNPIHLAAYADVTPLKCKPDYWNEDIL